MNKEEETDRDEILNLVIKYYQKYLRDDNKFTPGMRIPYSGRVFDANEVTSLVNSALDFWLTNGRFCNEFEKEFSKFLGIKYCYLVNSGSSANLLAFMALTSPLLKERQIKPGDEIITLAAGFPTTVTPILQYGAIPVFVDVTIPEYNIDVTKLERAITRKTKGIMIAHTLGNPFDIKDILNICNKHGLWLIEDNCDALGSRYCLNGKWRYTGTFGDIGTSSFYPPHHMTMGEGGAVYTNNPLLGKIIKSMRDWGRDCICPSGTDNFCGHRFDKQYGDLPKGYDHKYVYSHLGYNLKATDMQASIGCEQLKKLPKFIKSRKENWIHLYNGLIDLEDYLLLPKRGTSSDPSWFGFTILVKNNVNRNELVHYLESKGIQTRMLFAGNIIKHPCFETLIEGEDYRISGSLENTDSILNNLFWIGVYPGMNNEMIEYIIMCLHDYFEENK